jgi:hypothetical protein
MVIPEAVIANMVHPPENHIPDKTFGDDRTVVKRRDYHARAGKSQEKIDH